MSDEEINNLSYNDRCEILNANPVTLSRHFQYRVECFFKTVIIDGPLGKTMYYAIRVEFQLRGSPHIHCLLWILNAPILSEQNIPEFKNFVDTTIKVEIPDKNENPDLHDKVKKFQIHAHSQSCRKYKRKKCRFSFPRLFTDETIIAKPFVGTHECKKRVMEEKSKIIKAVTEYIEENLNPRKCNIYDSDKPNYVAPLSMIEILDLLGISYVDYKQALSISSSSDFEIHHKRAPNSCYITNYFTEGLLSWAANMDISVVLSAFGVVNYLCSYICKHEDSVSQAMTEAARTAKELNYSKYKQMQTIAHAYTTHRECSVQESVYLTLPELWLRKTFPKVEFVNTNVPSKRVKMCLSKEKLDELDRDSTEIFHKNNVDRYVERPHTPQIIENMCLASFMSLYEKNYKPTENDSQPVVLDDDVMNENHQLMANFPKSLTLLSTEKMKLRKVRKVLRFYEPNNSKDAEGYAHHLLMFYFPYRNENDLLTNNSYIETLRNTNVTQVVESNKSIFEPYSGMVDNAFLNFQEVLEPDPILNFEDDQTAELLVEQSSDESSDDETSTHAKCSSTIIPTVLSDENVNKRVRDLNTQQREIFELVHATAKSHLKNLNCTKPTEIAPLHLFLTGYAGTGKSYLVRLLFDHLTKLFSYKNPMKQKVLLLAPTGISSINIGGTTFYSALHIPPKCSSKLPQLSSSKRDELRHKFSELQAVIIDEISMVSQKSLDHISQRLNEIFGTPRKRFGGLKIVLVVGDFLQLPPVQDYMVFEESKTNPMLIMLWHLFQMCELTEVVRQKDPVFVNFLNNCRIGEITDHDINILQQRHIDNFPSYERDIIHLYAENSPVENHNSMMLEKLSTQCYSIRAIDKLPPLVTNIDSLIRNKSQMQLSGLATIFNIKVGARCMITQNIDKEDRLVNGLIGKVAHVALDNNQPSVVYMKFDDEKAGQNLKRTDTYARQNNYIPIKKVESEVSVKSYRGARITFRRKQFPLMLSYSATVHKVQGQQFPKGLVSFKLMKQRFFNCGQLYVALSRLESLSGLYVSGDISKQAIRPNVKALEEYDRLRKEALMSPIERFYISPCNMVFCHLNTRSFKCHFDDIISDHILTECDLILFTETRMDDVTSLSYDKLNKFKIHFHNDSDTYVSLAVCYRETIDFKYVDSRPGMLIFSICKNSFLSETLKVVLLYKKNNLSPADFAYMIEHIFSVHTDIDIVAGDFNEDGFNMPQNVSSKLNNYNQVVNFPTQIDGRMLDQVYVRKNVNFCTSCLIKHIYFSDHDATFCKFEKLE